MLSQNNHKALSKRTRERDTNAMRTRHKDKTDAKRTRCEIEKCAIRARYKDKANAIRMQYKRSANATRTQCESDTKIRRTQSGRDVKEEIQSETKQSKSNFRVIRGVLLQNNHKRSDCNTSAMQTQWNAMQRLGGRKADAM
jgi:hypothetical protein